MQKSTIIGLVAGFGLVFGAIYLGTGWETFLSVPSLLLVLGGTGSAMVVSYSFEELKKVPDALRDFLSHESPSLIAVVDQFTELSRTARRDGLLALDRQLDELEDDLTRLGLELAIDGSEEDEIREMLNRKSDGLTKQKRLLTSLFTTAGTYAPAFGMIGTLIGLVEMLQNLDDPSQIGSGMATALITTFYGALLANLAFLPIAQKARTQLKSMLRSHEMVRAGILAIVRGERPSLIGRRLRVFVVDEHPSPEEVEEAEAEDAFSRAA